MECPADASSVIYLAKASAFEVLVPVLGRLLIPPSVWIEAVEQGEQVGAREVPRIRTAEEHGLLSRVSLDQDHRNDADRYRALGLGKGESEVIALGRDTKIVVIDEGRGTRIARANGLEPVSTLHLVIRGFQSGALGRVEAMVLARALAVAMNVSAGVLAEIEKRLSDG